MRFSLRSILNFGLVLLAWMFSWGQCFSAGKISVSELNYHDVEDPELEFIELINVGIGSITLTGAQFTKSITYTFTTPTTLTTGERIVIVKNRAKFIARYGSTGIRLAAGEFTGRFADEGELVTLSDSSGLTLMSFTYSPKGSWPSRPDGLGSTLECVHPDENLDTPENWRASAEWMGSPGIAGTGPQKTVVINEILAHTDPPLEDAIELINLTSKSVDIGGWYVSNTRTNPRKFRIPDGTIIPANGYKVFYELANTRSPAGFNSSGTGNSPDFTFNSAHGDEAVLLSADSAGNPKYWMDTVSFEATANGISIGRYPNGTGKFTTLVQPTFGTEITATLPAEFLTVFRTGKGASNAGPLIGPIVFSRIQYHPNTGADEFVELLNISSAAVPLYDPLYPTNTWKLSGGVGFDFPTGVVMESGARLIVVPIDPAAFRMKYSIPSSIPIYGPWTNLLNNAGEVVAIYMPDPPQLPPHPDAGFVPYVLVEEVDYSPLPPWPTAADGSGPALLRKIPVQFGNEPTSWEVERTTPAEPPRLSISIIPMGVRLSFTSETGRTYRLEQQSSLMDIWTDQGLIPANGGLVQVDLGPKSGFYRVRVE